MQNQMDRMLTILADGTPVIRQAALSLRKQGFFLLLSTDFFDLSDDCLSGIMEKGKRHI